MLEANLYINTRKQSAELMLDNDEQVRELVDALRQRGIEFAIFDVFNVMHAADENDNTEMRRVLRQLSKIQTEVGCGIGVVPYFNKAESGSMTMITSSSWPKSIHVHEFALNVAAETLSNCDGGKRFTLHNLS